MTRIPLMLAGVLPICGTMLPVAHGQAFRIETVVTQSDGQTISENLTLLDENLIVDFMLMTDKTRFPVEIVAFDINQKRFVLMDTARKVRTELPESELLKILTALQGSSFVDDENRFFFQPDFEEDYDPATGVLEMRSPRLVYRTHGKRPEQETTLRTYMQFVDQFARLNATDPRRMPPFARLELNRAIRKYGFIPEEVDITLYPEPGNHDSAVNMKSTHVVMWKWSETDHQRMASAKRYWMEFDKVTLKEYRQLDERPVRTAAAEGPRNDVDR